LRLQAVKRFVDVRQHAVEPHFFLAKGRRFPRRFDGRIDRSLDRGPGALIARTAKQGRVRRLLPEDADLDVGAAVPSHNADFNRGLGPAFLDIGRFRLRAQAPLEIVLLISDNEADFPVVQKDSVFALGQKFRPVG
jgi:hypothetical protein